MDRVVNGSRSQKRPCQADACARLRAGFLCEDAMHHSLSAQGQLLQQPDPAPSRMAARRRVCGGGLQSAHNRRPPVAVPARDEDAVFLNAFGGFLHGRILPHLKGVIRERMQLRERNLNNYFLLRFRLLMARAFCPVLSALFFSVIVFLLSASDFGYKKGHFFFSEGMS